LADLASVSYYEIDDTEEEWFFRPLPCDAQIGY
jgi:hypothetical protein